MLSNEAPFADLSKWDALFSDHPLEGIATRQAASYGAFQRLAEFAWENKARLRKGGPFRTVLLQFDERFDWYEQELELYELFPGEPTDNLLGRLTYSAPRLSYARPELQTKSDRWAANGYFWFTIVAMVLWVLAKL